MSMPNQILVLDQMSRAPPYSPIDLKCPPFCCVVSEEHPNDRMDRTCLYGESNSDLVTTLEWFFLSCEGVHVEPEDLKSSHVVEVVIYEQMPPKKPTLGSGSVHHTPTESDPRDAEDSGGVLAKNWGPGKASWFALSSSKELYMQIPELDSIRSGQLKRSLSVLLTCDKHDLARMYEVSVLCAVSTNMRMDEDNMSKDDFIRAWRSMFDYIQKRERQNTGDDRAMSERPAAEAQEMVERYPRHEPEKYAKHRFKPTKALGRSISLPRESTNLKSKRHQFSPMQDMISLQPTSF